MTKSKKNLTTPTNADPLPRVRVYKPTKESLVSWGETPYLLKEQKCKLAHGVEAAAPLQDE